MNVRAGGRSNGTQRLRLIVSEVRDALPHKNGAAIGHADVRQVVITGRPAVGVGDAKIATGKNGDRTVNGCQQG